MVEIFAFLELEQKCRFAKVSKPEQANRR